MRTPFGVACQISRDGDENALFVAFRDGTLIPSTPSLREGWRCIMGPASLNGTNGVCENKRAREVEASNDELVSRDAAAQTFSFIGGDRDPLTASLNPSKVPESCGIRHAAGSIALKLGQALGQMRRPRDMRLSSVFRVTAEGDVEPATWGMGKAHQFDRSCTSLGQDEPHSAEVGRTPGGVQRFCGWQDLIGWTTSRQHPRG